MIFSHEHWNENCFRVASAQGDWVIPIEVGSDLHTNRMEDISMTNIPTTDDIRISI